MPYTFLDMQLSGKTEF